MLPSDVICFSLQWFIPLVMNDGSFPPNICFSVAYYWRWYYEVQNIERSGGDCSHCLSTSDLWGLNLIEIIESSLHYQKWPLQHGKTLGKVFFANLLINAADQPEALKVVEIILGTKCNTDKKWNVQYFQKKMKVTIPFPEKSPLIYANVHIPRNTRNQSFSSIGYCYFNSRACIHRNMLVIYHRSDVKWKIFSLF